MKYYFGWIVKCSSIFLIVYVAITVLSCNARHSNRSRDLEMKTLKLLGTAGGGRVNFGKCSSGIDKQLELGKIVQDSLVDKDIVSNLPKIARSVNLLGDGCEISATLSVSHNPTIDQIKEVLGTEDETEMQSIQVDYKTYNHGVPHYQQGLIQVTFYKYGWLQFGVINGEKNTISIIQADLKNSGY